jgi:hypothetical protein
VLFQNTLKQLPTDFEKVRWMLQNSFSVTMWVQKKMHQTHSQPPDAYKRNESMHRKTSNYPVSLFISTIFTDSRLSASEFVSKIGYKNISKGLRHFDNWLQKGFAAVFFWEIFQKN